MGKNNTCCVTGHREIRTERVSFVITELRKEVLLAIQSGCTHFMSGFAEGVDLMFARIVAELKSRYPITLEAAIPYPGRMETPDMDFQRLIKYCDVVKIHSDRYLSSCYMKRNRYMVDNSVRVIAVHDGRQSGGTAATMKYAVKQGRDIRCIRV